MRRPLLGDGGVEGEALPRAADDPRHRRQGSGEFVRVARLWALLQRTSKSLRECLCLITDLERDLDIHSRIESQIGEGRRLEAVFIEPEPHLFQSGAKIIIGGDLHFGRVHGVPCIRPQNLVELPDEERCSRDMYSTLTLGPTPRFGSGGG